MEQLQHSPEPGVLAQWVDTTYRTVQNIDGRALVAFCHTPNRIFEFSAKQWTLLYHLSSCTTLKEACEKTGITVPSAQRFLRTKEYKEFVETAMEIEAVVRGFPAIRVLYETIRQFKGEIKLDESQNKALDRLERILMPKKHESSTNNNLNIQVNNFPTLPADVVEKLKALGDARATETATA